GDELARLEVARAGVEARRVHALEQDLGRAALDGGRADDADHGAAVIDDRLALAVRRRLGQRLGEELVPGGESSRRVERVDPPGAVHAHAEDAAVEQDREVMGDTRPRTFETVGDGARRSVAFTKEAKDGSSCGMAKGHGFSSGSPWRSRFPIEPESTSAE